MTMKKELMILVSFLAMPLSLSLGGCSATDCNSGGGHVSCTTGPAWLMAITHPEGTVPQQSAAPTYAPNGAVPPGMALVPVSSLPYCNAFTTPGQCRPKPSQMPSD
jgi:hypothetical protein